MGYFPLTACPIIVYSLFNIGTCQLDLFIFNNNDIKTLTSIKLIVVRYDALKCNKNKKKQLKIAVKETFCIEGCNHRDTS